MAGAGAMTDRRLLAAAAALVAAIAAPLLWGDGVDVPDDAAYYGVASWEWLARAAADGVSPWWVPGKLGGVSLFSDVVPQGPFYPTILLALLLPTIPALGLAALLHAVGTLFAVRWLARIHGVRGELATLAGAAVAAGPLGVWAAMDFQVDAWPAFLWFPVTLACLEEAARARERADRRGRWRWIALGAAAVGLLALGTHLRVAIGAGGALGLWALLRGKDLRGAVAIGGIGLLAGAPGVVPMLLEAQIQGVGGSSPFGAPDQALGLWSLAGWLAPKATLHARDLGLGAVLGVGLIAAVVLDPRRRAVAFVALLLLAGSHVPGVRFLLSPLTALTRPVTLVYAALALIPAAVLAAGGVERLLGTRGAERARVTQVALGLAALAVLRFALGRWTLESGTGWLLYGLALAQLVAVATAARSILARRDPVPWLVALALLDLACFGLRAHTAVPAAPLRPTAEVRGDPALLADGFLDIEDLAAGFDAALRHEDGSPGTTEEDVVAAERQAPQIQRRIGARVWPVHACMAQGCRGLAGRSKLAPARTTALLAPIAEELADLGDDTDVVAHLFGDRGLGRRLLELTGTARALRGTTVLAEVPPERRSPPCYAVTEGSVVTEEADRVARLLDTPWWERPRLLEAEVPIEGTPMVACADPRDARGVVVLDGPGLVAVALPMHPGWRIDRAEYAAVAVDQVHQAVRVGAGDTTLRWRFVPPGLAAACGLAALGWMLIVALGIGARATPPLVLLLALALPAPLRAASIDGVVRDAPADGRAEAWLTTSLDLTRGDQPVTRSPVVGGRFALDVPSGSGPAWIFLRQEVPLPAGPALVFHRPLSLEPFDRATPPAAVRIAAVPEELARQRAEGSAPTGWWRTPLLVSLLVFLGAPLLRRRILRRRPGAALRPSHAAPRADLPEPPAETPMERRLALACVVGAAAIRLPGMRAPLDLLEWSYGPGTARVLAAGETPELLDTLLHPACLELVHPPLWHLLMQGLGVLGGAREGLLRAPALVASVATVWLVWRLGRRLNPTAGLLAALGMAVAAPAVEFGRDATPYAFLSFVAAGSLLLLLRALRRGTPGAYAAWLGLLVVGFLSHYAVALFAGAQGAILVYLLIRHRSDPRWGGAAAQALGVGPIVGAPAIGWAFLHFANFSPAALDTRLYADTYPTDPGLAAFVGDFGAVALGVAPSLALFAVPLAILVLLGLAASSRADRHLGLALAAVVGAFAGGTLFFYANLIQSLDGRIFWGFRWVSWFLPVGMVLAGAGLASTQGIARVVAGGLGLGWLVGTVLSTTSPEAASTHPDYRGAAEVIADQLQDRDGLVALPMWGQRGPVRSYLSARLDGQLGPIHDTTAWDFGGRAAYLETGDERLPFESGLINAHVDRIWVVVADERMFGRRKFSDAIARQALVWADAHLDRVATTQLDHLELILYRRRPLPLPGRIDPTDLRSRPWLEPNTPLCLDPNDEEWRLHVRVDQARVEAEIVGGRLSPTADTAGWAAVVIGSACSDPPPQIRFGRSATPGKDDQFP